MIEIRLAFNLNGGRMLYFVILKESPERTIVYFITVNLFITLLRVRAVRKCVHGMREFSP